MNIDIILLIWIVFTVLTGCILSIKNWLLSVWAFFKGEAYIQHIIGNIIDWIFLASVVFLSYNHEASLKAIKLLELPL